MHLDRAVMYSWLNKLVISLVLLITVGCAGDAQKVIPKEETAKLGETKTPSTQPLPSEKVKSKAIEPTGSPKTLPKKAATQEKLPYSNKPVDSKYSDSIVSADGNYLVYYQLPDPIPLNDSFAIKVWVQRIKGKSSKKLSLQVDAAMPHHQHGMNITPRILQLGAQEFFIQPMRFHMSGRWHFYFDVTQGAITERAEIRVKLK